MQSDFIFKTTDGKHTLTGYIGNDSIISLPENYNGENYSIGNAVFQNNKNITSITIPNSVISIGEKAFYNCTGLTSVTIPNCEYRKASREVSDIAIGRYEQTQKRGYSMKM